MSSKCPNCYSEERVRAGFATGLQRWKCKGCGCFYTKSNPRGLDAELKKRALELYLEGIGFRGIGRVLRVSHVSVQRWIKAFARQSRVLQMSGAGDKTVAIMELDEMWHYIGKKRMNSGSGWLLIECPERSSASGSVIVVSHP